MRLTEVVATAAREMRDPFGRLLRLLSMRLFFGVVVVMATLVACGGRTTSTSGGDESGRGSALAANDNGADAGDAGPAAAIDGAVSPTGTGAPASACSTGGDCASGVCFVGATRAFCTFRCTPEDAATVCAGPFEGNCNTMGYCRLAGGP